ncbi:O-acetyl-ADP-ribose deacetylase [Pseudactinotalea sp.]|uniref:O-acetyl-ADP-ribose deacetylase n=1 Tax=Pseudactinotalea sp. TaxID=1926260 RepID=UPI003B3BD161
MNARLEASLGDITAEHVDAIVNAANSSLMGGGGVDGAIHRAAGPALLAECQALRQGPLPRGLPTGQAVATGAGDLAARWVIHTVGPDKHRGQTDPALLASCFTESLRVAASLGATSVAFPAVSAGVYGWDVGEVASTAVGAVRGMVDGGGAGSMQLVRFVLFSPEALAAFEAALASDCAP